MSTGAPKTQQGECMRCGERFAASQLQKDGRNPSLLVCAGCFDPPHEGEKPFRPKQNEGKPRFPVAPDLWPGFQDTVAVPGPGGAFVEALVLTGEIAQAEDLLTVTVTLSWSAAKHPRFRIARYEVFRNDVLVGTIELEYDDFGAVTTSLVFEDEELAYATEFTYRVDAIVERSGARTSSNEITVSLPEPPAAPVTGGASVDNPPDADLTWTEPPFEGGTINRADIYRRFGGSGPFILIASTLGGVLMYTDTDLSDGEGDYDYYVQLHTDTDQLSLPSNTVTVTRSLPPGAQLSDATIDDIAPGGAGEAFAGIYLCSPTGSFVGSAPTHDGKVFNRVAGSGTFPYFWKLTGVSSDYEVRATFVSGFALASGSSALDTWLDMSLADHGWFIRNASSVTLKTTVILLEIRRASNHALQASATITLNARQ